MADSQLETLKSLEGASFGKKLGTYAKMSGPGWLQAAVTLGGGSLIGALYLGVIGGYQFMWLQPLAMLVGIIMLSAIAYVTLSSEQRPFRLVEKHVSPLLAWAWLIATIIADVVFCSAQFQLGLGAMKNNLGVDINDFVITGIFALVSVGLLYSFISGGALGRAVENFLKILVALVVLSFMGVVITLSIKGEIPWGSIFAGLIPNPADLFRPAEGFTETIASTGDNAPFWTGYIEGNVQNNVIAAFGAAVGINMTFLLPYTLKKRGWGKPHRELSRYDLALGLFVPFILATSFLVIAASSQFHAQSKDIFNEDGSVKASSAGEYSKVLTKALTHQSVEIPAAATPADVFALAEAELSPADRELAAQLVKRNANSLASSLEPFLGKAAQPIFGIGVLAMAISTMLVHMMMNGYAVSEAFNKPGQKALFMVGAVIPAITGFLSPVLMKGETKAALMIPTIVIAFSFLPIAYFTLLLLMNSRKALGDALPKKRGLMNLLLWFCFGISALGCIWKLKTLGTLGMVGIGALFLLIILGAISFVRRERG